MLDTADDDAAWGLQKKGIKHGTGKPAQKKRKQLEESLAEPVIDKENEHPNEENVKADITMNSPSGARCMSYADLQ